MILDVCVQLYCTVKIKHAKHPVKNVNQQFLCNPPPSTYLVVTYDMGLAVDEADEADEVESALCVDCITLLLLLLLGTADWLEPAPCDDGADEFGEWGPDEIVGLFFHG